MTCRLALQLGQVEVITRGPEDDTGFGSSTERRIITREEVLAMPRSRRNCTEAAATGEGSQARVRRLRKAPETTGPQVVLQATQTMPRGDVAGLLQAFGAFIEAAPDGKYTVAMKLEKAGD